MDKDRKAALETALERIEKDHGKGAVMRLGQDWSRIFRFAREMPRGCHTRPS